VLLNFAQPVGNVSRRIGRNASCMES